MLDIHGLIDPARVITYEIATSHSIRARVCRSCIIVCRRLRFCLAPPSKKLADICLVFRPTATDPQNTRGSLSVPPRGLDGGYEGECSD